MNCASRWTSVALAAAFLGSLARAQTTERVSVDSGGAQGNNGIYYSSISADGRFVAFRSEASNLVAAERGKPVLLAIDINGFVFDWQHHLKIDLLGKMVANG